MIPIVIMAIEDESDRDYIMGLFLKNERGMYAMALKLVKEHHTACDMVSESCLKMIEKIGYLREISAQKQMPYILSIVKNTSLMYLRRRRSENGYLVDDERILDRAAASQEALDAALISEAESQVIRQALKRLKPRDRDLLEMKYFSQLDDEKITAQNGQRANCFSWNGANNSLLYVFGNQVFQVKSTEENSEAVASLAIRNPAGLLPLGENSVAAWTEEALVTTTLDPMARLEARAKRVSQPPSPF